MHNWLMFFDKSQEQLGHSATPSHHSPPFTIPHCLAHLPVPQPPRGFASYRSCLDPNQTSQAHPVPQLEPCKDTCTTSTSPPQVIQILPRIGTPTPGSGGSEVHGYGKPRAGKRRLECGVSRRRSSETFHVFFRRNLFFP